MKEAIRNSMTITKSKKKSSLILNIKIEKTLNYIENKF